VEKLKKGRRNVHDGLSARLSTVTFAEVKAQIDQRLRDNRIVAIYYKLQLQWIPIM
jgi:PIN domain nuclease of toxin-antitoxin system